MALAKGRQRTPLSDLAFFDYLSNSNVVVCKGRQGLSTLRPKDAKDAKNAKGLGETSKPPSLQALIDTDAIQDCCGQQSIQPLRISIGFDSYIKENPEAKQALDIRTTLISIALKALLTAYRCSVGR